MCSALILQKVQRLIITVMHNISVCNDIVAGVQSCSLVDSAFGFLPSQVLQERGQAN